MSGEGADERVVSRTLPLSLSASPSLISPPFSLSLLLVHTSKAQLLFNLPPAEGLSCDLSGPLCPPDPLLPYLHPLIPLQLVLKPPHPLSGLSEGEGSA